MPPPPASRKTVLEGILKRRRHELAADIHHLARHYTGQQVDKIADICGITDVKARETLLLGIEQAATWFLSDLRSWGHPTPSKLERNLDKVWKSSSRLLRTLGLDETDPQDGMPPGPLRERLEWAVCPNPGNDGDIDAEAQLRKLVAAVGELQALAEMARSDAAKDKGKGKHEGNKALNEFITSLMQVYRQAGAKPGISRNPKTGAPSGPTLRFVGASLKHLIENVGCTDPVLAKRIPNLSDEAFAKRIKRALPRTAKSILKKT